MKKILFLLISFFVVNTLFSQEKKIVKADSDYSYFAFVDAIEIYLNLAKKGFKDENIFLKLANSYYFNGEYIDAEKWYSELFKMSYNQTIDVKFRYIKCLQSVGNFENANKVLETISQENSNDIRFKLYEGEKDYLSIIKSNSGRYDINNLPINSVFSDFGGTIYNNLFVFASSRKSNSSKINISKWNNQPFFDIYGCNIRFSDEIVFSEPNLYANEITAKFDESTPVFTKDGLTMYFTKSSMSMKTAKTKKASFKFLKIYKATLIDDKWSNIVELPINGEDYNVAHPALSSDDKTLYFVSDMQGTLGQSDIFSVEITQSGDYINLKNLGASINTEGKESFPFISDAGELYFSSDGRPGLGGLDVYVAKQNSNGSFEVVQNIGEPINSNYDDFAFVINYKTGKGFFSSNRQGGKGSDDIYSFVEKKRLGCEQIIKGFVVDKVNSYFTEDAKVSLLDSKFQFLNSTYTNKRGEFYFNVDCEKDFYVRVEKLGYQTAEQKIYTGKQENDLNLKFEIEDRVRKIEVGTDIAKTLELPRTYFEVDKDEVDNDAIFQLTKVLIVLKKYPNMKIEIAAHTDSRASKLYNFQLSQRRADNTLKWFISKGISKDRIIAKGYGEEKLVNKCSKNARCTEEEHLLNRRCEFNVLSIN